MAGQASAIAHPNFALVKYWGKSDRPGNVPAVPSLSITLDTVRSLTHVAFDRGLAQDAFTLDGAPAAPAELARVSVCLDALRARADTRARARVSSSNNFPTGAGLASSASGFAALVVAAAAALDIVVDTAELSGLARAASASAARSMFGGFVALDPAADALAQPLLAADAWPLEVVIAVVDGSRKATGSSAGMRLSADTSPYYDSWVHSARGDYDAALAAVQTRDFEALAVVTEHSTLKMHAVMQTSRPALLYWQGASVACMHEVQSLRATGTPVFFTLDAGPQLKAVCAPGHGAAVADALGAIPGVRQVIRAGLGGGARVCGDGDDTAACSATDHRAVTP